MMSRLYSGRLSTLNQSLLLSRRTFSTGGQQLFGTYNTGSSSMGSSNRYSTSSSSSSSSSDDNNKSSSSSSSSSGDQQQQQQQKPREAFSILSPTFIGTTVICTSACIALYQFKRNISDDDRFLLNTAESTVLIHFADPFREFLSNVFNNLREYSLFAAIFGPPDVVTVLPPPLPEGVGREYTLVIDIDSISEVTDDKNCPAVYKRGGLDYFLTNVSSNFEVILYSSKDHNKTSEHVHFKLDPRNSYFSGLLYGNSGIKEKGHFTLDSFPRLNRDQSKVLFIDSTGDYDNPNVINLGKFQSNVKEKALVRMVPILNEIGKKKSADMRNEISILRDTSKDISARIEEYLAINKIPTTPMQKDKGRKNK